MSTLAYITLAKRGEKKVMQVVKCAIDLQRKLPRLMMLVAWGMMASSSSVFPALHAR